MLGKRTADNARRLMVDLYQRLVIPKPNRSDVFERITQISTDGFAGYPEAVDLAFGPYAKYGQIIKDYRNADQPGRYAPPEMVGTERKRIFGMREGEEGDMHLPCRAAQSDDPHADEAVYPSFAGIQQEASQPGSGRRRLFGLL